MERIGQIEYDKSEILGKGLFVKIFRGTFRDVDEKEETKPVAVKCIEHDGDKYINFGIETNNLKQLRGHPNVVSIYGVEKDAHF